MRELREFAKREFQSRRRRESGHRSTCAFSVAFVLTCRLENRRVSFHPNEVLRHGPPKSRLTDLGISVGLSFLSMRFRRLGQPLRRQPRQLPYPSFLANRPDRVQPESPPCERRRPRAASDPKFAARETAGRRLRVSERLTPQAPRPSRRLQNYCIREE